MLTHHLNTFKFCSEDARGPTVPLREDYAHAPVGSGGRMVHYSPHGRRRNVASVRRCRQVGQVRSVTARAWITSRMSGRRVLATSSFSGPSRRS